MLLGLLLATGRSAGARDEGFAGATPDSIVTGEQAESVRRALDWIAAKQQKGGAWGEVKDTQISDTALSLLALMAGGSTLGPGVPNDRTGLVSGPTKRGPHAAEVEAGVRFLAQRAWSDRPGVPAGYIDGDQFSKMHGHGFATLALATACGNLGASRIDAIRARLDQGASPKDLPLADQVRWGLERAVRLTEAAQDRDFGGWSYSPTEGGHEGSMTVTQICALRAALAAGVSIDATKMNRAVDYVRKSQNLVTRELHGGFAYQIDLKARVSYALTAAALTSFFGLGRYGDKEGDRKVIDDGLAYMDRTFEEEIFSTREEWYYYRLFYAVQALYLSGDVRRRDRYWPRIRDELISLQNADGSFRNKVDHQRSLEYCTAMGCLVLEVPLETLPIFQRR